MNEEQKQHLTVLIKTSPILNAQEREEWLMLLDLMNDKQVGELERILMPKPEPAVPASTPMSHIVNLPKQPPVPAPGNKTFSKFAEHLNQILAEKDLPTAQQKMPLNLPKAENKPVPQPQLKPVPPPTPSPTPAPRQVPADPPKKSSVYDIMPVVVEQPIYLKKSLPPKTQTAPPEDSDSFVQSPEVSGKIINKILDSEQRPPSAPAAAGATEPDMADLSDIDSLKIKPKGEPPRAGLQNQDRLFQAAVMRAPESAEAAAPPETAQSAELSKALKLDEPADAAALGLGQWKRENPTAFIKRLQKIVGKRGYYEVIFSLQKSPLYSAYIDSGLKSLEAGNNFEDLGENYMTKKQFEDFTDLLRELQV